ncbi:E3 ubiquitin-protein ligase RBBP6 isoform X1 [Tripterygium wilfordii]|uniref:E3 ubiquitin-protein ligase RBBP6 isoform X1 n=1 Tax=Tripterygium wilfordii TaxID=458696 RepID=A0A7J7CQ32_TRIWF|nr:E3 ubiquitin-protein ligase RBBP6 isoform X1 [Tripterygium wilfordii]
MDNLAEYYPPSGVVNNHYYQHPPPPMQPPPPPSLQPYIPQQQPPLASYAYSYAPYVPQDQVRALFVADLPEDVKPREIYHLFREFPGYESSHLRTYQNVPVFYNQQSAIAAMHALNGMVFDLVKGSTLHIDLVKSNSRSKHERTDDEWHNSDKKAKGSADSEGFGSAHMPGMGNSAYNTIGYPSAQSLRSFDGRTENDSAAAKLNNSAVPPCPTLVVANLGPSCTEQELIQVFSISPGFLKLKMQSTYGASVAFVGFQDTSCSTGALNHLQGTILYSSPAGESMRLDYPSLPVRPAIRPIKSVD